MNDIQVIHLRDSHQFYAVYGRTNHGNARLRQGKTLEGEKQTLPQTTQKESAKVDIHRATLSEGSSLKAF